MPLTPEQLRAARVVALRVLFGARNGALYGVKVRFPHALVLTSLWHGGTVAEKATAIVTATATHAGQLCVYAAAYKALFAALQLARGASGRSGRSSPHGPACAALAGALVGGTVFRAPTSVNTQIVLFLFSRSVVGAAKRCAGAVPPALRARAWPLFAAATWALTMSLWEADRSVLATGLASSMEEIYEDVDSRTLKQLLDWRDCWRAVTNR